MLIKQAFQVGLGVRFQNNDAAVYKAIVWRAKLGGAYVYFKDDSEFSPQILIDNYLYVLSNHQDHHSRHRSDAPNVAQEPPLRATVTRSEQ